MDAPADDAISPLQDLIRRASEADQDIVTSQKNRALIREMAFALVAQARLIADLQPRESRIVVP